MEKGIVYYSSTKSSDSLRVKWHLYSPTYKSFNKEKIILKAKSKGKKQKNHLSTLPTWEYTYDATSVMYN